MSTKPNMQRGKRGANRRNKQTDQRMLIPHPPPIHGYQLVHGTRLRFSVAGAGFNSTISVDQLLNTILMAKTATTGSTLFTHVKVRAVEVWSPTPFSSTPTPQTVRVVFAGADGVTQGDAKVHTDTSMGMEPAYVRAQPTRKSLISNYQEAGDGVAFSLLAPAYSVVDVDLSFKQQFITNNNVINALVGATAGAIYLRGLDGVAVATTVLPPVLADYAI